MVGAFSGLICFGLAFALAGCLVLTFAGDRVASHADTAAGVARSRAASASMSASALILSPAFLARAAIVSTLVVGRPLKVTPFPFAWTLVGRVGFAGAAGLMAARLVPDGFAWWTDLATAGVRSSHAFFGR